MRHWTAVMGTAIFLKFYSSWFSVLPATSNYCLFTALIWAKSLKFSKLEFPGIGDDSLTKLLFEASTDLNRPHSWLANESDKPTSSSVLWNNGSRKQHIMSLGLLWLLWTILCNTSDIGAWSPSVVFDGTISMIQQCVFEVHPFPLPTPSSTSTMIFVWYLPLFSGFNLSLLGRPSITTTPAQLRGWPSVFHSHDTMIPMSPCLSSAQPSIQEIQEIIRPSKQINVL